jgi:hypothetical protein
MVFLGGKNEVSADFSVNFQKSAYIAYDCKLGHLVLMAFRNIWISNEGSCGVRSIIEALIYHYIPFQVIVSCKNKKRTPTSLINK